MKSYVIQWKSTINGRTGKGTKHFDFQEAQQLADELNREYPSIRHEPVEADAPTEEPAPVPVPGLNRQENSGAPPDTGLEGLPVVHDPDQAFSLA